MKRFSVREFVFLCSPILLVAGAGWFLSARQSSANGGPLRLEFHVEPPTTMEAFRGTDAVMVVALKGWNTQDKPSPTSNVLHTGFPQLEVRTTRGTQLSHFDGSSGRWQQWRQLWHEDNRRRIGVHFAHVPKGKLRFGMEASVGPERVPVGAQLQHLSAKWTISPLQIKPFSFKAVRPPTVVVRSAKITSATPGSQWMFGEVVFDLMGPGMNAQTPFDSALTLTNFKTDPAWCTSTTGNATPETPTRRVREFRLSKIVKRFLPSGRQIVRIGGRANADNCWPLSFQLDPFDFAKVKTGQSLPFKSWPAPIPKP